MNYNWAIHWNLLDLKTVLISEVGCPEALYNALQQCLGNTGIHGLMPEITEKIILETVGAHSNV